MVFIMGPDQSLSLVSAAYFGSKILLSDLWHQYWLISTLANNTTFFKPLKLCKSGGKESLINPSLLMGLPTK